MRRRDFISRFGVLMAGGAAAWPLAARSQQRDRMRRIGALMTGAESDQRTRSFIAAFESGLLKQGWMAGRNVRIDYRWAAGDIERYRRFAAELVGLRPDVILAAGTPSVEALRQATRSIPMVFTLVGDPIAGGFVASFARPGGNITGFIATEPPLAGKLLELLKDAVPRLRRAAFLYNPETASYATELLRYARTAAAAYAVELTEAPVHNETEIEGAVATLAREPDGGIIVLTSDFTVTHRERIIGLAVQHRLPIVSDADIFTASGGVISYAPDVIDSFRLAAGYVDRILKGEKPADLPVQAPVRFELIVNLKAAKAIGLTIPETFLVRADKVIE